MIRSTYLLSAFLSILVASPQMSSAQSRTVTGVLECRARPTGVRASISHPPTDREALLGCFYAAGEPLAHQRQRIRSYRVRVDACGGAEFAVERRHADRIGRGFDDVD